MRLGDGLGPDGQRIGTHAERDRTRADRRYTILKLLAWSEDGATPAKSTEP